jgi:hypothetical protein
VQLQRRKRVHVVHALLNALGEGVGLACGAARRT